ncbi:MAG: hypothetical protein FWK04_30505 [Nostoc sp. GBBB01]|nr:hypothetical protein [Nostoc sp. GBBB01]
MGRWGSVGSVGREGGKISSLSSHTSHTSHTSCLPHAPCPIPNYDNLLKIHSSFEFYALICIVFVAVNF